MAWIASLALLACSDDGATPTTAPEPSLPPAVTAPLPSANSAPEPLGEELAPVAGASDAEFNEPPADIQNAGETVRCLVDSPPGCDGCDRGDTCVYEELSSYQCVYVVYGTACPGSAAGGGAPDAAPSDSATPPL